MRKSIILSILLLIFIIFPSHAQSQSPGSIAKEINKLRKIHTRPLPPGPFDWLSMHNEPGQTFEEYLLANPRLPTLERNKIYIQPIGSFSKTQMRIVKLTSMFISLFYALEVEIKDNIPLSVIPSSARRIHPTWQVNQLLSTYILEKVLIPTIPKDAAAFLALTPMDLWPGEGWNFVFGQASIQDRVGVWSIYRNGAPDKSEKDFKLYLLRTMKTAVHEIGHMFTMLHCIEYECVMAGSNSRAESDKRPVYLCPECVGKVAWASGIDLSDRYKRLEEFCEKVGLTEQAEFYKKSRDLLSTN